MSLPLHHANLIGSAFSLSGQWFVYKRKWWGFARFSCTALVMTFYTSALWILFAFSELLGPEIGDTSFDYGWNVCQIST